MQLTFPRPDIFIVAVKNFQDFNALISRTSSYFGQPLVEIRPATNLDEAGGAFEEIKTHHAATFWLKDFVPKYLKGPLGRWTFLWK